MAALAKLEISGYRETRDLLEELPKRVASKGNRAAVNAAATPVTKAAKSRAPKESGLLKKSLGKKIKTYRKSGLPTTAAAIIGARRDVQGEYRGRKRVPYRYLHLVEKGTKHSAATHFLEDAYKATKAEAVKLAADKYAEVVEREAAKIGKK